MSAATHHDFNKLVVVGASAGGVEALSKLVSGLPAEFPAPLLITHHQAPDTKSMMPAILTRAGKLPARHAQNHEDLRPGMVYIAPPDCHLLVKDHKVLLGRGARENCTRPAVDPLFRTAARAYGKDVIAIILTGNLDDGTAGMAIVKSCGGTAIVQDPDEAPYPGMPQSAIQNVKVDHVLPINDIPALLVQLVKTTDSRETETMDSCQENNHTPDPAIDVPAPHETPGDRGEPSVFTCPDCHGTLWEMNHKSGIVTYRCRVGHAYSPTSLAAQQSEKIEEAMWIALRALEERAHLASKLVQRAMSQKQPNSARRFETQKRELESQARLIREILERRRDDYESEHEPENGKNKNAI